MFQPSKISLNTGAKPKPKKKKKEFPKSKPTAWQYVLLLYLSIQNLQKFKVVSVKPASENTLPKPGRQTHSFKAGVIEQDDNTQSKENQSTENINLDGILIGLTDKETK